MITFLHSSIRRERKRNRSRHSWARRVSRLLMLAALLPNLATAAAPPAGTSIGNQASATYTDSSNTERTATSNVAITIVQQVSSFTLTTDGQLSYTTPGGQVFFTHTLQNTGNGTEAFDLTVLNATTGDSFDVVSLALYADADSDGQPDNATAITTTGPLLAGASYQFVAVGIVPGGQTSGDTAILRVIGNGTATATPAGAQTNVDNVTVTANAVVNVTKSISASSGAPGSGPYSYTLTYNNVGNNTATNLTLMDVIPSGMIYVTNSGRWSVTGGTPLTDADGDSQGTAPDTVAYDFGITAAGRVTANIFRVQPGQSGTLTFAVTIAAAQPAGVINNTPTFTYDPGTGTTNGPLSGNTVQFTVVQSRGVDIVGQTISDVTQGATVTFTNTVQNTGNGTDTFDLTVTNSTFPPGTTFTLYQNDAATPLVDSSGNGIPDTGPRTPGEIYNVILKAVLPPSASGIGVNYTALVTATSVADATVSDTDNDIVQNVNASTVDLSNGAAGGAGPGPEAAAVVVNTASPGVTTRFTLFVTNTSTVADFYNLAGSTNSSFATQNLPDGWTLVFRDVSQAIVTSTGVINAGEFKQLYADVTIPATNAPGTFDIYFRVLSPTTSVSDILHDAVQVNSIRSLALSPNNTGQVTPGGFVVYSHLLVNSGNVIEGDGIGSSITLSLAESLAGWNSVVYYDANNNGAVDATESIVTNLTFVSGAAAGVSPGETVRLLVQVFAPPGAPVGAVNISTLSASTVNGTYSSTAPVVVSVSDNSSVISGDIQLVKEQALDADLDGAPDTAYGTADITTGALPGRAIRYRITVSNSGTAPATQVKVFDSTPAYTVYTATGPAATTLGSVGSEPADNTAGSLMFDIGTLNPGQSAVITFGVIINP